MCVWSNTSTHTLHQKEVWPLTQTKISMPQSGLIHLSIKPRAINQTCRGLEIMSVHGWKEKDQYNWCKKVKLQWAEEKIRQDNRLRTDKRELQLCLYLLGFVNRDRPSEWAWTQSKSLFHSLSLWWLNKTPEDRDFHTQRDTFHSFTQPNNHCESVRAARLLRKSASRSTFTVLSTCVNLLWRFKGA